jgi:hypothetical protein
MTDVCLSVHPRCPLCLCGESFASNKIHHRGTEFTEIAQRVKVRPDFHEC